MNAFVLSDGDRAALRALIDWAKRRPWNTQNRPAVDLDEIPAPEAYAVRSPGIPPMSGAVPGRADCEVFRIVAGVLVDAGFTRAVYNTSPDEIASGLYPPAVRDKFGAWLVIGQGIGLGTGTGAVVPVSGGGTGDTTLPIHGILLGQGASPIAAVSPGAVGSVLIGQGSTADPAFVSLSGEVTVSASGAAVVSSSLPHQLILQVTDSSTSIDANVLTLDHLSTAATAAGFGTDLLFRLHSSTNTLRNAFDVLVTWASSTDASRRSQVDILVYDTTFRKILTGSTSGSAPELGVLGASPVVRQSGDIGSALVAFGWMSGSPTLDGGSIAGTVPASRLPTLDAISAPAANVGLAGFRLTGVGDPSSAQDAATKNYVDLAIGNLVDKADCQAATVAALAAYTYNHVGGASGVGDTITLTVAAVLVLDGYTPILNDRILIKNEAGANRPYNGIYRLTTLGTALVKAVLTRALDFDQSEDGLDGAHVFVQSGTINANTEWYCSTYASITFGTTDISFSQFTGSVYTADEVTLHLTGTSFSILSVGAAQLSSSAFSGLSAADLAISDVVAGDHSGKASFSVDRIGGFINPALFDFRLSLVSLDPCPAADQSAKGTLYLTPCYGSLAATSTVGSGRMTIFDGTRHREYLTTELSLSLTLTSGSVYDVFVYNNGGTLTLSLAVWTSTTNRGANFKVQDGVLYDSGGTKRFCGTLYASGTNQCSDTVAVRGLWNMYNRRPRKMRVAESASSWAYTTATWRQANANGANVLKMVRGLDEDAVWAAVYAKATNTSSVNVATGIGVDTSTAIDADCYGYGTGITSGLAVVVPSFYCGLPGAGYHYLSWNEISQASGTTTWYSTAGLSYWQSGIGALVMA